MQCKGSNKNKASEVPRDHVINNNAAVLGGLGFCPASNGRVQTGMCHDQNCILERQF